MSGTVTSYGLVSGRVQGVGFRYFVQRQAQANGVDGWARNLADGRVEVLLSGPEDEVAEVQRQVAIGPPASRVTGVRWEARPFEAVDGFLTG